MKAPSPPPTPDPYKTAAAQQVANVEVALANSFIANADEETPQGNVTYIDSGKTETTYTYDGSGNATGSRVIKKPKRIITLSPKGQQAYEKQEDVILGLNVFALAQVGYLQSLPSIGTGTLTPRLAAPAAASVRTDAVLADPLVRTIGSTNLLAHLATTRDAIESRLTYQRGIDRDKLITMLAHQGIFPGMQAYSRALATFDFAATDAQLQVYLQAGQEQSRIIALEGAVADFANRATAMKFDLDRAQIDWTNSTSRQRYQALVEAAEFVNVLRERELQEQVAISGSNINLMSTLMQGGQVPIPQFQGFRPGVIDKTPVAESVYQSAAMDMQKWQVKVQSQQQMMGGLLGLGGNLLGGMFALSDVRLKRDIRLMAWDRRGFGWYSWRYIWDQPGSMPRRGVLAQEVAAVLPRAVMRVLPGDYLAVNYGMLT